MMALELLNQQLRVFYPYFVLILHLYQLNGLDSTAVSPTEISVKIESICCQERLCRVLLALL